MSDRPSRWIGAVLPLIVLAGLELWLRSGAIVSDTLAPPSAIAAALATGLADGSVLRATGQTLAGAFGGLLMGGVLGMLAGILFAVVPLIDRAMEVTVEALRPIPSVALLPVALMVFGFGYGMEFAIVGKSCFFLMLILTRAAVRGVEPRLREVARALRLSRSATVGKIILPAILPRLFVAFRLAASLALVISITIEIAVNPQGLGYGIMTAQQALRPDLMLAYFFWIGFIGLALNALLLAAQGKLFGRAALAEAKP
ncbi:ABC transporter permease [Haematobacter massiliensis]|uniref:ABC transporter permease n=2 Tax=Haematobacter massiliensis TaxID=195105 RepID=A0A086Y6P0_9RHOB|nr:ABC transporter permease subunit [Haematobacter massiliensis]KFI29940.1 ABC transporter permease [Haematobacter massiliensis]OWJ72923.1 ABC transporter permease [Haematobacter massiliensis]QBJ25447.1 ABC transporter permease subunit [Haematobacter massiliensis]